MVLRLHTYSVKIFKRLKFGNQTFNDAEEQECAQIRLNVVLLAKSGTITHSISDVIFNISNTRKTTNKRFQDYRQTEEQMDRWNDTGEQIICNLLCLVKVAAK